MQTIAMDKADTGFKHEIAAQPGAKEIKACFSCGTCTGACPVFRVESEFNPRRLIRMILLGLRKQVLTSPMIWLCRRCYACAVHCPQGVSFADIIVVLRDIAVKEGYAPAELRDNIDKITESSDTFRKNCIAMAMGQDDIDSKEILKQARETVKEIG